MAEWLGSGLQNRVQQFESAWNLIAQWGHSLVTKSVPLLFSIDPSTQGAKTNKTSTVFETTVVFDRLVESTLNIQNRASIFYWDHQATKNRGLTVLTL